MMPERFWHLVCPTVPYVKALLTVTIVLLVLLIMAFPFVTPGTDTYYISLASFVGIFFLVVNFGYVLVRCGRMADDRR